MSEGLQFVLIAIAVLVGLSALSVLFVVLINNVKDKRSRTILIVALSIFFLPVILTIWSMGKITPLEESLAPFSWSLRARSRIVLLLIVAYGALYYWLYTVIF